MVARVASFDHVSGLPIFSSNRNGVFESLRVIAVSFHPDIEKRDPDSSAKFCGIGSLAVTHDHWADVNTSKSWVHDILIPYYQRTCVKLGLVSGTQRCVLLVDCWWGWLDAEFRECLKREHPYVLFFYVPACFIPVGQPSDAGMIAILKGDMQIR
jgi:hypothetical protein